MISGLKRRISYYLLNGKNRLWTIGFLLFILMTLGVTWWLVWGQFRQSTEDAYVEGNIVHLHTQQAGNISGIYADTLDQVKAGDLLIQLNGDDAELALDDAASKLAQTVRDLKGLYAKREELSALVAQHESEVLKASTEYNRRLTLYKSRAISQEELQHAKQQLVSTQAVLFAAKRQLDATAAQVDGTDVKNHPSILAATTNYRNQYLKRARTKIYAPISGMVTKRMAQLGQQVSPGGNLLSIVNLNELWVTANFKESQLKHLKIGQPAIMHADLYGSSVTYHGRVLGIDVGTGSAFALLPAQNATGNWIKVVQRVPVRISLDPKEIKKYPLRIGLSMRVTIKTNHPKGLLGNYKHVDPTPIGELSQYKSVREEADKMINQIIDENWIELRE